MGDENQRRVRLPGEFLQQLQDLRLHGYVEGSRRLVGDDEPRLARERHGDHHTLPHAAGELMRVIPQPAGRVGNANPLQQRPGALIRLLPRRVAVQPDRFRHLFADGQHGIERRHRLLEDHGDAVAPNGADGVVIQGQQVLPVKEYAAGINPPRIAQQAQDGKCRHALAGTALANDGEGLTSLHLQRHAIHRPHQTPVGAERDRQAGDVEKRRPVHHYSNPSWRFKPWSIQTRA